MVADQSKQPVLTRDEEISNALKDMVELVDRMRELGAQWLSHVLGERRVIDPAEATGLVINRDFLPSGWIRDERIPLADMAFIRNFISSPTFTGLRSLHEAACHLDESLIRELAVKETTETVGAGDYSFEWPAMER